jgi:hypothetical protein
LNYQLHDEEDEKCNDTGPAHAYQGVGDLDSIVHVRNCGDRKPERGADGNIPKLFPLVIYDDGVAI